MGCISRENCTAHGCPAYFDCPSLTDRQPDKCYLYGKVYAIGEQIPTEETTGSCVALRCSGVINDEFSRFDEVATFSIAYIECPELFFPRPKNCIRQFKSDQCVPRACNDLSNNHKCQYGNLTLNIGDTLESVTTSRGTISCRCEIPPLVHCVLEDATRRAQSETIPAIRLDSVFPADAAVGKHHPVNNTLGKKAGGN
ncbi:conserved hypothetical protein [Culex quinquefasciatus]|uniref:Uncharacterized protein n=1 Tax=Culex quinquefasciatus TaxID=7176 RepID=B0X379_CULQU|nr:conserved hypothetical protein [Culex quinquefasciatus]|eukprot:XP_001864101.1 conserved hypothetical protein [Culex quinquefasciatus]